MDCANVVQHTVLAYAPATTLHAVAMHLPQSAAFTAERIRRTSKRQEALGLDVLVHGEFERNDMVDYFGEQLAGFAFPEHGCVQSFPSVGGGVPKSQDGGRHHVERGAHTPPAAGVLPVAGLQPGAVGVRGRLAALP